MRVFSFAVLLLSCGFAYLLKLYLDTRREKTKLKKLVKFLEEKKSKEEENKENKKVYRVLLDGVFDVCHYGHFNAIRQASKYGDCVIALDSQKDVEKYKGSTIYTYEERKTIISSLRFVKDIIDDMPYAPDNNYVDYLLNNECIDYAIHGDDLITINGQDTYAEFKRRGAMKIVKRTEGISTTDLLGRILLTFDNGYEYIINDEFFCNL